MSENLNLNDLEQVTGGNDGMGSYAKNSNTAKTYTIQAGDTLYSIARKFNTTAKKIFDANSSVIIAEANKHGITCNNADDYANHIWPGTVLVIPA